MIVRYHFSRFALCAAALLLPATARAHDGLLRSSPAAGARLTTAPSSIELVFGARIDLGGTLVELVDGAGRPIPLAPPTRSPNGRTIRVAVAEATAPGAYTIRWRIVGRDGHPVRGTIAFSVVGPAIAASPGAALDVANVRPDSMHAGHDAAPGTTVALRADTNPLTTAPPPDAAPETFDSSSPAYVVARWLTLVGLIATIGAVVYRMLVLPRAGLDDLAETTVSAARVGLGAAGLLVLGNLARLVAQGQAVDGISVALSSLGDSSWGTAWLVQMTGTLVALAGFAYATRGAAGWIAAGAGGLVAAVGLAMSGHAVASDRPMIGVAADTVHIVGGSGWLGTLGALFTTTLMRARATIGEERERAVALLVTAFSPLALGFAGLAAATGVVLALLQLPSIAALFGTAWGRVLLLKLGLVAATAAVGAWNWRRVRPRLGTTGAAAGLRRSAWVELITGALVILATAVLVGIETPH